MRKYLNNILLLLIYILIFVGGTYIFISLKNYSFIINYNKTEVNMFLHSIILMIIGYLLTLNYKNG